MSTNKIKIEVYSTSHFSDLMASPAFYSVSAVALVLGLSSMFGFLQSPNKLKSTVDSITQKVMVYQTEEAGRNFISAKKPLDVQTSKDRNSKNKQSDVLTELLPKTLPDKFLSAMDKQPVSKGIQTLQLASFDYDITSKHFWTDLDLDDKHNLTSENQHEPSDVLMIGVPVEPALIPKKGDSKYSLKIDRNYRI